MSHTLRPFQPADFETLYEIDQVCYPRGIAYSRAMLRGLLAERGAICLVAETEEASGGQIIGFVIGETYDGEGHVITIDVIESHRRAGVGTSLLLGLERIFRQRGVREAEIETATSNEAGVAFWQRHGYRTAGVLRGYYPGRLDAYVMRKAL